MLKAASCTIHKSKGKFNFHSREKKRENEFFLFHHQFFAPGYVFWSSCTKIKKKIFSHFFFSFVCAYYDEEKELNRNKEPFMCMTRLHLCGWVHWVLDARRRKMNPACTGHEEKILLIVRYMKGRKEEENLQSFCVYKNENFHLLREEN